jgi:cyanophycinase
MKNMYLLLGLPVLLLHCCSGLFAAAPSMGKAGKLVIAGGALSEANTEIWNLMLAERLEGRPIGILSTASEIPEATGVPLVTLLNRRHGEGSAVFIPASENNGKADDPETVALIRRCGGFFFTGGQQIRTTRALLTQEGNKTAGLEAIWDIYLRGGVIGGSSAGAAIMSHPMITGGSSADALFWGATPADTKQDGRGVGYGPGLGFHPGWLYCQHHLERGRLGRLVAALVSKEVGLQHGVGIAEDTAWVVDQAAQTGTVIGSKGVIYLDASQAAIQPDGGITSVKLHYLDRGDSIHLKTGQVRPARGKTEFKPSAGPDTQARTIQAWDRDAIWHLLENLAQTGSRGKAVARDPHFDLEFQRVPDTHVWRITDEPADARPSWTITGIHLEVRPHTSPLSTENAPQAKRLPSGKAEFNLMVRGKKLKIFTYRPRGYKNGPLFVVMHGLNRNAEDYRNHAIPLADRFQALVVAPCFGLAEFPVEAYQRGGVIRDDTPQPMDEWTFQVIPEIVSAIRSRQQATTLPYYLIGHSAGGQFLNRMAAFLPGDATRIIASNPGSLIFPTRDQPFQYGFGNLPEKWSDDAWIKNYLAAPLTLFLGTDDIGSKNLENNAAAMRQGNTRIERGRACFMMAQNLARERGWPFNWTLVEAEGVGHDSAKMFAHPMAEKAIFGHPSRSD